jgi:hypothetical protein
MLCSMAEWYCLSPLLQVMFGGVRRCLVSARPALRPG